MSVATLLPTATSGFAVLADPLETLRGRVLGQIITANSAAYDEARALPYITVDRRPLAIIRVATAGDVATTVNFARERGLSLTVRNGGHSLSCFSVVDNAIVVDI